MSQIIQNEFVLPVEVTTFDTGADDRLRLSAVLRYQQEAAERQLAPGGLGWRALAEHGMAFVASRWHTTIQRLPVMGERVSLTTWHRERRGPRFFRCYEWRDEQGTLLLQGVMLFALVSVEEHRLLRGEAFDRFGLSAQPERGVACADPGRLSMPACTPVDTVAVRWSDIDRNGHVNNTRYADWLCDYLPKDAQGAPLQDVHICFSRESLLGDRLVMSGGTDESGAIYVQGEHARGLAFEARGTTGASHGL